MTKVHSISIAQKHINSGLPSTHEIVLSEEEDEQDEQNQDLVKMTSVSGEMNGQVLYYKN